MRNISSEEMALCAQRWNACTQRLVVHCITVFNLYFICVSRIVADAQRFTVKGTYCKERSYNCTEISNAGFYTCILLPHLNNRN